MKLNNYIEYEKGKGFINTLNNKVFQSMDDCYTNILHYIIDNMLVSKNEILLNFLKSSKVEFGHFIDNKKMVFVFNDNSVPKNHYYFSKYVNSADSRIIMLQVPMINIIDKWKNEYILNGTGINGLPCMWTNENDIIEMIEKSI